MNGKDIRKLIVSLTQAKKMHQQKAKAEGPGSESIGQSMWDKVTPDDDSGVPKQERGSGESGKAEVNWVQCDSCKKWRTLPPVGHPNYPSALDDDKGWVCGMNTWSPHLADCQVPEESMLSPTAIKIRVWLRRLRTGDKYETRNNLKPLYDKKAACAKSVPVDWIRCCSPLCGKWRACLRTMNGEEVKAVQVSNMGCVCG